MKIVERKEVFILDDKILKEYMQKFKLKIKLVDSDGYYIVGGDEEIMQTSIFLDKALKCIKAIENDNNVLAETITHSSDVYIRFSKI